MPTVNAQAVAIAGILTRIANDAAMSSKVRDAAKERVAMISERLHHGASPDHVKELLSHDEVWIRSTVKSKAPYASLPPDIMGARVAELPSPTSLSIKLAGKAVNAPALVARASVISTTLRSMAQDPALASPVRVEAEERASSLAAMLKSHKDLQWISNQLDGDERWVMKNTGQ